MSRTKPRSRKARLREMAASQDGEHPAGLQDVGSAPAPSSGRLEDTHAELFAARRLARIERRRKNKEIRALEEKKRAAALAQAREQSPEPYIHPRSTPPVTRSKIGNTTNGNMLLTVGDILNANKTFENIEAVKTHLKSVVRDIQRIISKLEAVSDIKRKRHAAAAYEAPAINGQDVEMSPSSPSPSDDELWSVLKGLLLNPNTDHFPDQEKSTSDSDVHHEAANQATF